MREAAAALLADVIDCLDRVTRQQVQPLQACAHLNGVRKRHPEASIELVWEDQTFDGALHYDALIRDGERRAISVSVCPDDALPWPLRGLQRWRDSDLLRVNGVVLQVADALFQLDMLWDKTSLMQRLVDSCLVEAELQHRAVEVTAAEVQTAFDDMRRRRGLLSAAELKAWMLDSGSSLHALENLATNRARVAKLRDLIAGDRVDGFFDAHRGEFETIALALLTTPSKRIAADVASAIAAPQCDFFQAAQSAFVKDRSRRTQLSLVSDPRQSIAAELGVDLTNAFPGQMVGPLTSANGWALIHVLSTEDVELSPAVRTAVKDRIFSEWLHEQRRAARIEWFRGETHKTAQAVNAPHRRKRWCAARGDLLPPSGQYRPEGARDPRQD
jgi:putative peptide maturation system protein